MENLEKALKWVRREYSKRRDSGHPSHVASAILEEAESKFDLKTCGTEGFCDEVGDKGVTYLNTGDSYGQTLLAITSRYSCTFKIGCWADYADICRD